MTIWCFLFSAEVLKKRFFVSFFLISMACHAYGEMLNTGPYWLDPNVVSLLQNADVERLLERPALEFANGQTVSTCQQYLNQKGDLTESSQNFSARSHYLICDALALVEPFSLSQISVESNLGQSMCSKLNLATFRHSFRQSFDEDKVVMSQLPDGVTSAKGNVCQFEGEERNFVLTAILQACPVGEPPQLWLWVTDEILDGTYRSYKPVWFVFDKNQDMWLARH